MEIGHRIQTVKQLFNRRHSIDPWSLKMHPGPAASRPWSTDPTAGGALTWIR